MTTKTTLSLDVSPSSNPKILRLFDSSHYHPDQLIENYLIEVLPVNKSVWLTFNVAKNFSLTLNSSNLRYQRVGDYDDLIDLPDGIYEFKQSIKPNIHNVQHFLHLRLTTFNFKLNQEKVKLIDNRCDYSRLEFTQKRDELRDIEEFSLAAKWMIEEEHNKVKGKELFEHANQLLEHYTNGCKC